jgi:hypothetical protein
MESVQYCSAGHGIGINYDAGRAPGLRRTMLLRSACFAFLGNIRLVLCRSHALHQSCVGSPPHPFRLHGVTISFCAFKSRTSRSIFRVEKKITDQNGRKRWNSSGEISAKCWQICPKFAQHISLATTVRFSSNAEHAVIVNAGRLTMASASTSTTASLTPRWRRCSRVRSSASIVPAPIRLTTKTDQSEAPRQYLRTFATSLPESVVLRADRIVE